MKNSHDTTSTSLSMALNFLAMNPDIQEKAREEARQVLNGKLNPTFEDLKELNYTTQIIKETLRLWPPVFNITFTSSNRRCRK